MNGFLTNYHTHTPRCRHAKGTEREMVEAAIASGLKVLGFADHCPYPGVGERLAGVRMALDETEDYFNTISALRDEYRGEIEIHAGLETEYLPECFDGLMKFLEDYPCEYLIMGQHFASAEGPYYGAPTADEKLLHKYVDQVLEGLGTGRFLYLAHPDLPNWQGDEAVLTGEFRRLCRGALELDIPLEVNVLGYRQHRCYPSERFFRIAAETGNTLVMGVDAHDPRELADRAKMEECFMWAERFGLKIIDGFDL